MGDVKLALLLGAMLAATSRSHSWSGSSRLWFRQLLVLRHGSKVRKMAIPFARSCARRRGGAFFGDAILNWYLASSARAPRRRSAEDGRLTEATRSPHG